MGSGVDDTWVVIPVYNEEKVIGMEEVIDQKITSYLKNKVICGKNDSIAGCRAI